jgi:acyl carrier protein
MLEKIVDYLKDHLGDANLEITEQTSFSDLGLDSLDLIQLVMELEDKYGVTLDMDEPVKTVGEFVKIIDSTIN